MTSAQVGQVRRGVVMVGPPYLYNGAEVCGRRASRTCIFLLSSFGTALTMIGFVLLTADLRMESGMWAAGVVGILLGVVLLIWFLTLCCAARCAFKSSGAARPARPVLITPRSSTYQLLPMTPTRTQATSVSLVSGTQTLPVSASPRVSTGYRTWNHAAHSKGYEAGQIGWQPGVYTTPTAPIHPGASGHSPRSLTERYHTLAHPSDSPMTDYRMSNPLTAHTLNRHSPAPQPRSFAERYYSLTHPSTLASSSGYVADDNPPPYHTVVSGP